MEILAWLAAAMLLNAACMAYIMKWQAHRIRGWTIRRVEALGVHARASLASALCALLGVALLTALPELSAGVDFAAILVMFFVPYYFWLRRVAYQLAKSQTERGRGVARRNVKEIASATFATAFGIYATIGGIVYLLWWLANNE